MPYHIPQTPSCKDEAMTEEIKTKKCSICGEIKPLEEFAKKTGRKDNVSYCCILCNRKRHKKWYEANPEVSQAYRDATAEGRREYDKARYEEKYDEIRIAQAEYYDEKADQVMAQQREALKKNPAKGMWKMAKNRVQKTGKWEFTITEQDIVVPEFCPVFGMRLEFGRMPDRENSPSLDRIDSTKGYIPGNVAVISWAANKLKSNGTADQHRLIADWMDAQKETK